MVVSALPEMKWVAEDKSESSEGHRKQLDEYQRFSEVDPKKSEDDLKTQENYRKSPEVFVFVFTDLNHVFLMLPRNI